MLAHAIENDESDEYLNAIVDELISLTDWHFKHEERLMIKHGYGGLQDHHREHQALIESAKKLQQQLRQENKTPSGDEIEFLEHWLTGHILGADMEMSAYLNEVM